MSNFALLFFSSGPNHISLFPLWFFLACGPAVYIALALKTLPNFKPNQWMLLGGLQIAVSLIASLKMLIKKAKDNTLDPNNHLPLCRRGYRVNPGACKP